MADLSHLPVREPESDPIDLSSYTLPSETFAPPKRGIYLAKIIDGQMSTVDETGTVPIKFNLDTKDFLFALYSLELIGLFDQEGLVTDEGKGRIVRFQYISRSPFRKGSRVGSNMMADMLKAIGHKGSIHTNQEYANALEWCIGMPARCKIKWKRGIPKLDAQGEPVIVDGKKVYINLVNFNENGEATYDGQIYKAFAAVDSWLPYEVEN